METNKIFYSQSPSKILMAGGYSILYPEQIGISLAIN